jgi:ribosome-binding ATPase
MSIEIGIIGLPKSGKTTVFYALTGGHIEKSSRPADVLSTHIGVAKIPEPRLKALESLLHSHKVTSVEARYLDVGASVKSLVPDKGIGGELLNRLNTVDTLIYVVRSFRDDSLPHPQGNLDVGRDIESLNMDLFFSDLTILERRLEKLEESMKGAKPPERQHSLQEKEVLLRFKAQLEFEKPIRNLDLEPAVARLVANYQFLTAKPLGILVNIGEDQLSSSAELEADLSSRYAGPRCRVLAVCAKLEMELAALDNSAAVEFRSEYGLKESWLERVVKLTYELSNLITFFTIVSGEVRAWSITKGTTALKAAGKIHSDMEKGFIRAEGIGFDDMIKCGSIAEARKQGLLRLEGKDYVVRDGDIITFLFNV